MLNGKGGVGKTMTTINLSAVFARNGGAGVLAWDNNQTRGTLGWSTEQGPHEATILDLLPKVPSFLGPAAQGRTSRGTSTTRPPTSSTSAASPRFSPRSSASTGDGRRDPPGGVQVLPPHLHGLR
jgi:hypothetical protein